jgi:xanthine dehydrogenase/oxidase
VSIDASPALKIPGVAHVVTHNEIPGSKKLGTLANDEEFLASEEVVYYGQPVALVLADSARTARVAAGRVEVKYADLEIISTIEEAISAQSYLEPEHEWKCLTRGSDAEAAVAASPNTVAGEVRIGGQEHLYIEPQACLVEINGGQNVVVHCTSQNPTKIQRTVAAVLGIGMNHVESRMERIGGGFGGKQDRPQFLAAACAVGAAVSGRPVRIVLEREEDMQVTGQRHEMLARYKAAYEPHTGKIMGLTVDLFANGGCSVDLSPAVVEVALFSLDNCYRIEPVRFRGIPCRTNRVSCTAYRGFGKPQAMAVTEAVLDHIAKAAHLSPISVHDSNLLETGEKIWDGTCAEPQLAECWKPLREEYDRRRREVDQFNSTHVYTKRGIGLVPSRCNIGFETDFLNQAGALVNVYLDGTVYVTHGGSEMGQGLGTKLAQIAADELGAPLEMVRVGSSRTESVPNTTATAASTGIDLNGPAVADAARIIRTRLDKFRTERGEQASKWDWLETVKQAYFARVHLSSSGFFSFPHYTYSWQEKTGRASLYNIWGAGLAQVELDVLTGQWRATSMRIRQDAGSPLNPAIDIGQIEGGLAQGMGLYMLEELTWARDGHLRTRNVSTYKVPTHDDIPTELHIELLSGRPSAVGVVGSKATSEVGVQLAAAVLYGIKDAVYAYREQEAKVQGHFRLDTPATVEKIRMACPTPFNAKI